MKINRIRIALEACRQHLLDIDPDSLETKEIINSFINPCLIDLHREITKTVIPAKLQRCISNLKEIFK